MIKMEVDRGVLAGAGAQTSVTVALHPLVIMNVSEHWTRIKAQQQNTANNVQVVGALLGKQNGRHLELNNSFELPYVSVEANLVIDRDFFKTREAQYKEVFHDLEFLGWYTTGGDSPTPSDINIQRQMCEINESPIFLKLNPTAKPSEKLPIHVFESIIDLINGQAVMQFVELKWTLATEEAERIGVDHVARISASSSGGVSSATKQLYAQHGAIKMLHNRLQMVLEYLRAIEKGELPRNDQILREIASLCHRLPVVDSDIFKDEFRNLCGDIKLMAFLGTMTKTCGAMNQLYSPMSLTLRNLHKVYHHLRHVSSSASLLANAFNAPQICRTEQVATGLFNQEALRSPDGFGSLNYHAREECGHLVDEILHPGRERKVVEIFDDLSNVICCGADMVECIRMLHSDPAFSMAAEDSMTDFTELVESLNTDQKLYKALLHSRDTDSPLDDIDVRVLDMLLHDFESSGVHLNSDKRRKFVELSAEIFQTGAEFMRECDRAVQVSASSVPDSVRRHLDSLFRCNSSPFRFLSLDNPLGYSPFADVRKWAYQHYYQYSDSQEQLLGQLVSTRQELAKLTGYESFAQRSQLPMLLNDPVQVEDFLLGILKLLRPTVDKELELLQGTLGKMEKTERLGVQDIGYLSGQHRSQKLGITRQAYTPYLSVGTLMDGFSALINTLYGCRLENQTPLAGEIWCDSVRKLAVYQGDNLLGYIYCDLAEREGKQGGDCHFTVRCARKNKDGSFQIPIVVLSLGFPAASDGTPSLLSPPQAENLFHEMGHAMHSMLGRSRYQHVAGTRCTTDLAETPSNLMEYFFYDRRVLPTIAKHYRSGYPLPPDMALRLEKSRTMFSATELQQQACYALFDLRLHAGTHPNPRDLFIRTHSEAFSLPLPSDTAWYQRFSHLVPYGAKYYSYLVAKASASLVWKSSFKNDPFSRSAGCRWAAAQSYGGERPMSIVLRDVLGREPSASDLVSALAADVLD